MTKERNTHITLPAGNALVEGINVDNGAPRLIPEGGLSISTGPIQHVNSRERIDTYSGVNGRFRPCFHTKFDSKIRLFDTGEYLTPPSGAQILLRPVMAGPSAFNAANPSIAKSQLELYGGPTVSPSEWAALDARALAFMLPSMNQGISLVNFLLELKDFKTIFRRDVGSLQSRLTKFFKALAPSKRNLPFRELSKLVLFKEFALDPLFSDLGKIYSGLKTFQTRLADLENRSRQKQSRRFTAPLEELDNLPGDETTTSGFIYRHDQLNTVDMRTAFAWGISPTYNATCRYVYALDNKVSATTRRAQALLDTLGVRRDPSIIWNAIPFTFIVDWFVNVSNLLQGFASDNVGMRVEVIDFCSSIVSSLNYRVYANQRIIEDGVQSGPQALVYDGSLRHYDRRIGRPNIALALTMSGLSAREAFLSAALIGANIPKSVKTSK